MEIPVEIGRMYAVSTNSSCTVSIPETMETLVTATAGQQAYFMAQSNSVIVSDDNAQVTRANFKGALIAVGGGGGGSASNEPLAGFTQVHFLGSEGGLYIDTEYTPQVGCEIWVDAKKYANYTDAAGVFGAGTGANGTGSVVGALYNQDCYVTYFSSTSVKFAGAASTTRTLWHIKPDGMCSVGEAVGQAEVDNAVTPNTPFYLFSRGNLSTYFKGFIYNARIKHKESIALVPALDKWGEPCMVDQFTQKAFYKKGTGQFMVGLTMEQAMQFGRNLPLLGGELIVYLPVGYESTDEWLSSKAEAQSKGWELTLRSYTPEDATSTYAMRRGRTMVWCRVAESANGEYCDAQNNRFNIEWCVEIVNPHGKTPADYGYELFDSIEQAAEAWGLTPFMTIPDEEDLTAE